MPADKEFKTDLRIQTAAEWATKNPFLDMNDLGIESDTGKQKVGVGKRWEDTGYFTPAGDTVTATITAAAGDHVFTFVNGILMDYLPPSQ